MLELMPNLRFFIVNLNRKVSDPRSMEQGMQMEQTELPFS